MSKIKKTIEIYAVWIHDPILIDLCKCLFDVMLSASIVAIPRKAVIFVITAALCAKINNALMGISKEL